MKSDSVDKPFVTIVTLTYKKFDRLFDTIKSVIEQDYPNIEYIIADDGSPNFPHSDIVSYFKNKEYFNYLILENNANQGTVKNINNAYKKAHGIYFINLSCGDAFYSTTTVSTIIKRMIEQKADVLVTTRIAYTDHFQPRFFLPHRIDIRKINKWNSPEKQYKAFVTSSFLNMASGSAMHFSREAMETMGFFDERYILWEDGPFIEKYLRSNFIHTAYDIISIWYEFGGISNSGMNPLLHQDSILFSQTDKLFKYKELSLFDRLKVDYRNKSLLCSSKNELRLNKLKCLPAFIYFFYQWLRDLIGIEIDKKYINNNILKCNK